MPQTSSQSAQCVAGTLNLVCGNNLNLQLQQQLGNLDLARNKSTTFF